MNGHTSENNRISVLIVEDSPTQAQRLEHILVQRGFHVTHAANGRLALERLQQEKPDIVISDVVMPEMDGYELCHRIKHDARLSDVPVILVTTLSDPGDVIRGLECRADNFILKPYDDRYLVSRVQFVLLNRQMRQAEQGGLAVEIFFNGQKHVITADRLQILNLLLSTYEAAIQRNRELTAAEEETRRAKQEAERANRAKSDFLSRMSHDLRTPLNAILGFAQLLEMDAVTEEQREYSTQIVKAGGHLLDLINEILDISRIEAGHLSLSPEPVPVDDIVQHAIDLVRPLAKEREIAFDVDVHAMRGCHVLADRQRLNQVLLNLLANAVKYNRPRGRVMIRCEQTPLQRLRISVSDTGAGIPPEKVKLLFQPFERLGAQQTGIEGTGLGLMLSKALTEAMGGAVGVESEVDRGSTFWVELASVEGGLQPVAAESLEPAAVADSPVTATVLYIEDNVSNQRVMERVFARRAGARLITASDGRAGVELARAKRPDLILLDLHLPDMHGEEVLRQLWEDTQTRPIPVAVLSADAMPAQAERLLAAGATAYLTKPIDLGEIFKLLDRTLAGAAQARRRERGPHEGTPPPLS